MRKKDRESISIRMDRENIQKLRKIAQGEGRTLSGQADYWLRACIRAFEQKNGSVEISTEPFGG